MLTVRAPATSANLGPGYDCLSLALDVANVVQAWPSDRLIIDVSGEGAEHLPTDAGNEVYRAVSLVYRTRVVDKELASRDSFSAVSLNTAFHKA